MPSPRVTRTFDTHVSGMGVKELSYYACLSNLLNLIGNKLKRPSKNP